MGCLMCGVRGDIMQILLDEKQACLSDIAELRTFMVAFLKVLDMHIKSAETTSVHFVSPLPTPEAQDLRRMSSMY